jgi:hypothetical protein
MPTPCHKNSVGDFGRNRLLMMEFWRIQKLVKHWFENSLFIWEDLPSSFLRQNFKLCYLFSRGVLNDFYLFSVRQFYSALCITVSHVAHFIFRQCVSDNYNAHALILKFAAYFVFLLLAFRVCVTLTHRTYMTVHTGYRLKVLQWRPFWSRELRTYSPAY